jgi:hypothetical protein
VKLSWLFILVMVVAPAVSRQLSDEAKAWVPWLIRRLVQHAVRKLPVDERERFAEEWPAVVNEIPGDVGKLIFAMRLLVGSRKLRSGRNARKLVGGLCR